MFNPFSFDENRFLINDENSILTLTIVIVCLCRTQLTLQATTYSLRNNSPSKNCFSMFHVNCRNIVKSYINLLATINLLSPSMSVIALSELWTDINNEDLYNVPGFNSVIKSRVNKIGGGVGLYIAEGYDYILRDDLLSADVDIIETGTTQYCCWMCV